MEIFDVRRPLHTSISYLYCESHSKNISWYSVFSIFTSQQAMLRADYITIFVPKFVIIEPELLEIFENVAGVRFFLLEHSVCKSAPSFFFISQACIFYSAFLCLIFHSRVLICAFKRRYCGQHSSDIPLSHIHTIIRMLAIII